MFRHVFTSHAQCNVSEPSARESEITSALWPVYNLLFPFVLAVGIIGNLMNLLVLTRPSLKGVTYIYLTGLATADLAVMISAVPAVVRFNVHHSIPLFKAFYHAYIELVLTNAFMVASICIVCFMTIDRYFSVCRPSEFKSFHTKKNAIYAISASYGLGFLISTPLAALKMPCAVKTQVDDNTSDVMYSYQENTQVTKTTVWLIYLWVCEPAVRVLPAVILAVFNCLIISAFHKLAQHQRKLRSSQNKIRCRLDTTERRNAVRYRLYLEEQRLVHLLTGIIVMFFVTMTPATVLSLIYSGHLDEHYGFQVFRAVANVLEVCNFALNFFVYCLCSKQFRKALWSLFKENIVEEVEKDIELNHTRNITSASK